MLFETYIPESELETQVRRQVSDVKQQCPRWEDPEQLCADLGVTLHVTYAESAWEGAALDSNIIVRSGSRHARQIFTTYHEIVHVLIRCNNQLYSTLHDQYPREKDLQRIIERLCNVGAAEFLIPRDVVRQAVERSGFSLSLLPELMRESLASPTAITTALGLYAQHRCVALVCRWAPVKESLALNSFTAALPIERALQVEMAISSKTMTSVVARGTIIPHTHFFCETLQLDEGVIRHGRAPIPFRANHTWVVECEALRIGNQVFGICHADQPLIHSPSQLCLL